MPAQGWWPGGPPSEGDSWPTRTEPRTTSTPTSTLTSCRCVRGPNRAASMGLEVERLRRRAARELEPGIAPSCTAAVHAPGEAAVDPRTLVAALIAALEACGGELVTDVEVVEPMFDGRRLAGVRTADGAEHRARHVVLAAGCWSGALGWLRGPARPPVRPAKGQVLPLPGPAGEPCCPRCDPPEPADT